jgi:hypothetical protein
MALLVAATFALSMSAVMGANVARQYELLALLSVSLITLVIGAVKRKDGVNRPYLLAIAKVTAAGALTHYHFFLPASAVVIFAIWALARRNRQEPLAICGAVAVGYLAALLAFPVVSNALSKAGGSVSDFHFLEFGDRLSIALYELRHSYYVLLMGGLLVGVRLFQRRYRPGLGSLKQVGSGESAGSILFFLVWILGGILLMYATAISPRHAMGPRYLSMTWPLLAFLPYFALRMVNYRKSVILYFYLVPIILAIVMLGRSELAAWTRTDDQLRDVDLLIIDNPARGVLLPIIWEVPDDYRVVVGRQDFLLENWDEWIHSVSEDSVYLSSIIYSSTETGREQLLGLMAETGLKIVPPNGHARFAGASVYRFCSEERGTCE